MEYSKVIKNINKIIIANFLAITLLTACHADEDKNTTNAAQDAGTNTMITGIVKETMNGGGYTYISLSVNGETRWIAGPKTEVSVGSTISIAPPMPMTNFKSEALNREFETIYFTGKIFNTDGSMKQDSMPHKSQAMPEMAKSGAADPHAGVDMGAKKADPHAGVDMAKTEIGTENTTTPNSHVNTAAKKSEPIKGIKKAKNGKTIDDVLKQKKELAGKSVKIRGKVIKFTAEVMNKNWIHIKDSSTGGDLTITTAEKAKVGDTIIVDGKIAINKDFGYGYLYDVILEDAKVTIE
ncbi:MAG: hypothetical protein ACC653_04165 [Gammaproteobacteria bacterium]